MRVLLVLAQQLGNTGSGVFTINVAEGLRRNNCDVRILCASQEPKSTLQREVEAAAAPVQLVELPGGERIPGMSDIMPYPSRRFSTITAADLGRYAATWDSALRAAVEEFKPDVIHVNHLWVAAAIACRAFAGRVVVTVHGTDLEQWVQSPLVADHCGVKSARPVAIHVVSENVRLRMRELGAWGHSRAAFIPPPLREDLFHNEVSSQVRDSKTACFVGKLSDRKGLRDVLSAFAAVKRGCSDARLRVVGTGDGDGIGPWRACAKAMGLGDDSVSFAGALSQADLAAEFRHAGLIVLGSWWESFGLVAVEAAACGCGVVMPAYGGADRSLASLMSPRLLQLVPVRDDLGEEEYRARIAQAWLKLLTDADVPRASASTVRLAFSRMESARRIIDTLYGCVLSC